MLPHDLSMTWSKKNENWSKIVGGVGFWKIAQKLKKMAITQKLSKNLKKFHQQKRLRIWFYTFLVSFRKNRMRNKKSSPSYSMLLLTGQNAAWKTWQILETWRLQKVTG